MLIRFIISIIIYNSDNNRIHQKCMATDESENNVDLPFFIINTE